MGELAPDGRLVSIAGSLVYALANLFHPRMLWLMLWPMLVSLALWVTLAIVLWARTARALADWLQNALVFVRFDLGDAAMVAAHVVLFLLFVPLVYLTALVILSVFGMDKMIEHVASRSYPALERRRGGAHFANLAGSAANGVAALLGMAGLALVSVPLWFFPPLWPLIPVAIFGWANQRLLRYDALAEHAEPAERAALFRELRGRLYLLGVLFALAAYVPVLGLLAPVVFGLAFIHYLLGALRERREAGAVSPSLERKAH
ncbi:MAG: EI24 domain-containing protein [Betaproteobacteria bacterium]